MKQLLCLMILWLLWPAGAGDIYVSASRGRAGNPGTAAAPLPTLRQALVKAAAGDVIRLAEGNYAEKGAVVLTLPVSLVGGYSADFTDWDPARHRTYFRPLTGTPPGKSFGRGILKLDLTRSGKLSKRFSVLFQGLIFDDGAASAYSKTQGLTAGLSTGKWLQPQEAGRGANRHALCANAGNSEGDITVKDCLFVNTSSAAVNLQWNRGNVMMVNNVFCNCRTLAAQVTAAGNEARIFWDFAWNTVVFTWCRQEEMTEMGHGVRVGSRVSAAIHDNLIGLNTGCGVSAAGSQPGTRKIKLHDNLFFANRKGDVRLLADNGELLAIPAAELEKCTVAGDLEGAGGNRGDDGIPPEKALDAAYLAGFQLVLAAKEATALPGMYANCYPTATALKIFGAVAGKGAGNSL